MTYIGIAEATDRMSAPFPACDKTLDFHVASLPVSRSSTDWKVLVLALRIWREDLDTWSSLHLYEMS